MKLNRTFAKRARPDGRMIYKRRQRLIMPITLVRAVLALDPPRAERTFAFAGFLDGELLAEGEGRGDEPFVLVPNLRIPRGERTIRLIAGRFEPNEMVTGRIEIEYTLF